MAPTATRPPGSFALQAAEAALTLGTNLFSSTHGMPARTLGGGGPISVDSLLAEAYPSLASLHGQQQAHMGLVRASACTHLNNCGCWHRMHGMCMSVHACAQCPSVLPP